LRVECGLKPHHIVRLCYHDFYQEDGSPRRWFEVRLGSGYRAYFRRENISPKLQKKLIELYPQPLLFAVRAFNIPLFTDRPINRVLTRVHIGRITRKRND